MPVKLHSFQMRLKTSLLSKFNTQRKVKYKLVMISLKFFFFEKEMGVQVEVKNLFWANNLNLAFHNCIRELAHKNILVK